MAKTVTEDDLSQELSAKIDAATTLVDLLALANTYWSLRYSPTLVANSISRFRERAESLSPGVGSAVVMVVDLPAFFHAAFSATNGTTDAIDRTRNRVADFYKEIKPTQIVFAVDSPRLLRKHIFENYKCSRPPKERSFQPLLDETIAKIKSRNGLVVQQADYESDDVMCSIAYRCKLLGQTCVLVSEDSDLWQCLGHGTVVHTIRGHEIRNDDWLSGEHNINPRQVVDWLCLVGKNDIPGASGIGEKTASKWLHTHGNIIEIFDRRDSMPPHQKESLEAFWPNYWQTRQLHTLVKTLAVEEVWS